MAADPPPCHAAGTRIMLGRNRLSVFWNLQTRCLYVILYYASNCLSIYYIYFLTYNKKRRNNRAFSTQSSPRSFYSLIFYSGLPQSSPSLAINKKRGDNRAFFTQLSPRSFYSLIAIPYVSTSLRRRPLRLRLPRPLPDRACRLPRFRW